MPKARESQTGGGRNQGKADYQGLQNAKQDGIASMPFATRITRALLQFGTQSNGTTLPRQSNFDPIFAEAFMWDFITKYAKKQSEGAWARLENEGAVSDYKELEPGEHEIGSSPTFVTKAKISLPVNRFDPSELATRLHKSKYKVPMTITLQAVEAAKVPKNSNRALYVEERGTPIPHKD